MTAEAFVELHGPALLQWLQTNTVECACTTPFGPDENLQRGTIDLTTSIACRRCYSLPLDLVTAVTALSSGGVLSCLGIPHLRWCHETVRVP